jgi:hypothetical protein
MHAQWSGKKANPCLFHHLVRATAAQKILDKDPFALVVTVGWIEKNRGKDLHQRVS